MGTFVADFETTTNPNDCRVWAYAIVNVNDIENDIVIGTTIDDFMKWCMSKENHTVMFHNLKFDGQFILYWLFKNGYEHTTDSKYRKDKTFTTLISDKGLYYQIEVIFKRRGKKINKVIFQDSLKLIPLSVDQIAKSFKLPISKLKIDYDSHNNLPVGSELSKEEIDYITNDVKIVAYAINYFYSQGLNKMTIGSCALEEYKKLIGKNTFKRYYPSPKYHDDVKQSYRGGFTWCNDKYQGEIIENGIVLDVNSLYPSVMYGCNGEYLPFGEPLFFEGKYVKDEVYPLYTQMFRCIFYLKPGKIPTIQIKYGYGFKGNEYLKSSGGEEVVLCLNSVDLKLFFEQYDVYSVEYISGWKFRGTKGLFTDYIDKWSNNKIQAKKEGNHGLYLISKLFLNSLYGKFGTDNKVVSKIPYLDEEENIIKYKDGEEEEKDGVYIAMASFITSYARLKTITSAQKVMDNNNKGISRANILYCDTDSMHIGLFGEDEKEFLENSGLDIDDTKLGAWKFESKWKPMENTKNGAVFLRQKCYLEYSTEDVNNPDPEYELKITVAGMPKTCYDNVTFENFKIGASYKGKKQPKIVKGGCVLLDIDFTIKEG